jgi:hypothetical protein
LRSTQNGAKYRRTATGLSTYPFAPVCHPVGDLAAAELGLAAAAAHHVMLASPNTAGGNQQTAQFMEDDILVERLPIANGPLWGSIDRSGLGVEVDEAKLMGFDRSYREVGDFPTYAGKTSNQ